MKKIYSHARLSQANKLVFLIHAAKLVIIFDMCKFFAKFFNFLNKSPNYWDLFLWDRFPPPNDFLKIFVRRREVSVV